MASSDRIILRLNSGVEFERDLMERYEALPRPRRQEWIRLVLRLGLDALDQAQGNVAASHIAPAQPSAPVPRSRPPVPTPAPTDTLNATTAPIGAAAAAPAYRASVSDMPPDQTAVGFKRPDPVSKSQISDDAGKDDNRDPKQLLGMW